MEHAAGGRPGCRCDDDRRVVERRLDRGRPERRPLCDVGHPGRGGRQRNRHRLALLLHRRREGMVGAGPGPGRAGGRPAHHGGDRWPTGRGLCRLADRQRRRRLGAVPAHVLGLRRRRRGGWLSAPQQISSQFGDPAVAPGDTFGIATLSPTELVLGWGSAVPGSHRETSVFAAPVSVLEEGP